MSLILTNCCRNSGLSKYSLNSQTVCLTPRFPNGIKNLLPPNTKGAPETQLPVSLIEEVQSDFLTQAAANIICFTKFGLNILFPYRRLFLKRRRNSKHGCCGSRCKALPWESRVCSCLSHFYGFPHCTTLLFVRGHGEHLA